jgi:hypothetical protein
MLYKCAGIAENQNMRPSTEQTDSRHSSAARRIIGDLTGRYPDLMIPSTEAPRLVFPSGVVELDSLFTHRGIPYGQLIELTGAESSGKTRLLHTLLASLTLHGRGMWFDPQGMFCPEAALASGIDLRKLLAVSSASTDKGLRVAEILLEQRACLFIVLDLTREKQVLPIPLLHRLRLKTLQAKGLTIFLTESQPDGRSIIPASMTSLKLLVERISGKGYRITVTKSRICKEGEELRVSL